MFGLSFKSLKGYGIGFSKASSGGGGSEGPSVETAWDSDGTDSTPDWNETATGLSALDQIEIVLSTSPTPSDAFPENSLGSQIGLTDSGITEALPSGTYYKHSRVRLADGTALDWFTSAPLAVTVEPPSYQHLASIGAADAFVPQTINVDVGDEDENAALLVLSYTNSAKPLPTSVTAGAGGGLITLGLLGQTGTPNSQANMIVASIARIPGLSGVQPITTNWTGSPDLKAMSVFRLDNLESIVPKDSGFYTGQGPNGDGSMNGNGDSGDIQIAAAANFGLTAEAASTSTPAPDGARMALGAYADMLFSADWLATGNIIARIPGGFMTRLKLRFA